VGLWRLVLGVTLLGAAIVSAVVPGEVVLRGQAVDGGGNPLVGTRAYVVRFFDAETGGTLLAGPITGTTTLTPEGLFSIPVVIPDAALDAAQVWYELGIDSDAVPDGVVSGSEVFVGRVRLWSVPYARVSGRVETVGVEQLAGGVVSTSEFTALDGVTGNIQAQLNTKANAADVYTKAQVDASQAAQDTVIAQKANTADVYTKAQVDASQAAQDTLIAQKADSADVYTKSEVDTSQAAQDTVIGQKAHTTYVDAANAAQDTLIAQKANSADVYTKAQVDASQAAQDTLIAQKADSADVYTKSEVDTSQAAQDTVIAQKADTTYVDAANAAQDTVIAQKADTTYVDAANAAQDTVIAQKADTTYVDTENAAQDTLIAQKANSADVYTKSEVDTSQAAQDTVIAQKANAADVYTKSEVDASQAAQDTVINQKANTTYVDAADAQRFRRQGESYVIVEVTNNPTTNAANLVAAYAVATALTPYGQALSATNRAVVLLPPGRYDLGTGALSMTAEYVDVVGMSTVARHQHVYGKSNGPNTGVVMQTANDVRLENLWVECTRSGGGLVGNSTDPVAYFPASDRPLTEVRNCVFTADNTNAWSMRIGITYSGKYTDCTGGDAAFGGFGGTASGAFTNCTGGGGAFGGVGGTASGAFTNCTGGVNAFGGNRGSTLNGRFVGCTMTGGLWFGTFRGRMENCRWNVGFGIGAEGRVYSSIILGNVTLSETGAGIANSSIKGTITVGGGVTPGFDFNNLQDPDVN
jgi:hypothetical protein